MSTGKARRLVLRPDLDIVEAESAGGRPAILVHDPVSGNFDRVEWPESDIIQGLRTPSTIGELLSLFTSMNTQKPSVEDMSVYVEELGRRGWLKGVIPAPRAYQPRPRTRITALLARSLFIQIPLLRPENFLRETAFLARLVINPLTMFIVFISGVAGMYLALPRWEDYWRDSFGSFGLARLPAFMLALIVVKAVHEFAHAYVATLSGARVSSMGVAFFFFMPLPFTDVTDAWRLPWSRRLRVAAAGMMAETGLASVALLLWALSPPGAAAMTLARLSSLAIVSTLLTNLNPGPRFDGYYVLVCLFRTENLRARSMAALRRFVWGGLLGLEFTDEDRVLGRRHKAAMFVYAVYAVFYRISLGMGLAFMAYYLLPKVLGLPAAIFGLWLFLAAPALGEVIRLRRNEGRMRLTLSLIVVVAVLAGLCVWAVGSWPRRISFPAVTRSTAEDAVRTRRSGEVDRVLARRGEMVGAGEVLAVLRSEMDGPLTRRAEWAVREAEIAEEQAWRSDVSRRDTAARGAEIQRRRVELDALHQRAEFLNVDAPASGTLAVWDQNFIPGISTGRGRLLGWIIDGPVDLLSCYPDIETAGKIEVGMEIRFFPDDGSGFVRGRVIRIDASRPETLEDAPLASVLGAVSQHGALTLPSPYAKVVVQLDGPMPRIGQTGKVWAWSKPESLADAAIRWLRALAVRESGF